MCLLALKRMGFLVLLILHARPHFVRGQASYYFAGRSYPGSSVYTSDTVPTSQKGVLYDDISGPAVDAVFAAGDISIAYTARLNTLLPRMKIISCGAAYAKQDAFYIMNEANASSTVGGNMHWELAFNAYIGPCYFQYIVPDNMYEAGISHDYLVTSSGLQVFRDGNLVATKAACALNPRSRPYCYVGRASFPGQVSPLLHGSISNLWLLAGTWTWSALQNKTCSFGYTCPSGYIPRGSSRSTFATSFTDCCQQTTTTTSTTSTSSSTTETGTVTSSSTSASTSSSATSPSTTITAISTTPTPGSTAGSSASLTATGASAAITTASTPTTPGSTASSSTSLTPTGASTASTTASTTTTPGAQSNDLDPPYMAPFAGSGGDKQASSLIVGAAIGGGVGGFCLLCGAACVFCHCRRRGPKEKAKGVTFNGFCGTAVLGEGGGAEGPMADLPVHSGSRTATGSGTEQETVDEPPSIDMDNELMIPPEIPDQQGENSDPSPAASQAHVVLTFEEPASAHSESISSADQEEGEEEDWTI